MFRGGVTRYECFRNRSEVVGSVPAVRCPLRFSGGLYRQDPWYRPDGLVEVRRSRDIVGDTTITNQYNFGLYCVLEKAPNDDVGAAKNADWIVDLQEWVQEQSATGAAPVFGDDPRAERITAQNGTLLQADGEGTGVYVVQLSVQFIKKFKGENKWLI